jgi:selenocysteine lyase/cysteine desulfurase
MNWKSIRAEFPALANWTYLNSATYGQVSLRAQAAVAKHFQHRDELACTDFISWFDEIDEIRALIGRLIHCEGSDIAFTLTASAALSQFLGGIDWRPGDRIVTLADEFPNHYYYARWLAARGVELIEADEIDSLPERTRAVVISTVNYTSGYRPDCAAVVRLAREAGALTYIDGTQSLGALQFDIRAAQPDMFAVDGYKWMLCPNGATFFYVSPALKAQLTPAVFGWRSDKGWRSVAALNHGAAELPDGAERYEGGMLNFPVLYAMGESIRMFLEIGPENIERRVLALGAQVESIVREKGGTVVHSGGNIVAANWNGRNAEQLAASLKEKRIVAAARHGNLRISAHFYNNEEDLEKLRRCL